MHPAFLIISFPSHVFFYFFHSGFAAEGTFKPAAHNQQLCVFCFVPMLVLGAGRPILPPEDSVALKGHRDS